MKRVIIEIITAAALLCSGAALCACQGTGDADTSESRTYEENSTENIREHEKEDGSAAIKVITKKTGPDTSSRYSSSFRRICGEDIDVVYFGKPRKLKDSTNEHSVWVSSDDATATVTDGVVTGWKEGKVTVTEMLDGETVQELELLVTTFNDGRNVASSYELGNDSMVKLFKSEMGVPAPEYLQFKINTLKDAVSLLQYRDFYLSGSLPMLANDQSEWMWTNPPESVLLERRGGYDELSSAVNYLLRDDFEKSGFLMAFGTTEPVSPWFYEDGYYYVIDIPMLIERIENDVSVDDYVPFKTDSVTGLSDYFLSNLLPEETLAVIMTDNTEYDFLPPIYRSYVHNSRVMFETHVVIGMEDEVMNRAEVLFVNNAYDVEIKSFPSSEVPDSLNKAGQKKYYEY